MNVYENPEIRHKITLAFPKSYLNHNYELIVYPRRNSYICLQGVEDEETLKAKVLEWLSRDAVKGGTRQSMAYHLNGINQLLGTSFCTLQMATIYAFVGNCINHERTLRFIRSGYDMKAFGVSDGEN